MTAYQVLQFQDMVRRFCNKPHFRLHALPMKLNPNRVRRSNSTFEPLTTAQTREYDRVQAL